MGSVDIPPFLRDKAKKDIQAKKSDIPPFLQKKSGGEGVSKDLSVTSDGELTSSVPSTLASPLAENPLSYFNPIGLNKRPVVNVAGANVPIDVPIQDVSPIPQVSNQNELTQQLQNRINTKTYNQNDVGVIAQSMGVSAPAADAFMQGKVGTGTVIHFNDVKKKQEDVLRAAVNKANTDLGVAYNYDDVFASPELAGTYLQKIEELYQSKANQQSISSVQKGVANNPIAYTEGFGAGVIDDTPSKSTLNAAQQIKGIISNDIIDKVSQDNSLNVDQKVNKIYELTDSRDKANVKKAIDKRLSPLNYLMDVAIGGDTEGDIELLNSQKASIEYRVNNSLNDKLNYNVSLKKSIAEDYGSKVASGEISVNDEKAKDYYTQQINAVDQQIEKLSTQIVPVEKLYSKYPVLFKSAVVEAVNNYNAIKSGNVKGYEEGGYNDTSLEQYLTSKGFDINDQKVKDVLSGDNFKDYSFIGRPIENVVDVFKNTGKALLDLTPLRDDATILAEKKQAENFPTQVGANDELQLTKAAQVGQNIGNTTGQVIGQALLQYGTAGLGRMAGLSRVAAMNAGFWSSGTLTSYDQAYKDSYDFIDNPVGRTAYAGLIALANGASEKIFPDVKVLQIPGVADAVTSIAKKASANELTHELADELLGKAKNAIVDYGAKYAKNVGQEVVEETATDLFESGTRFLFGDPNINADKAIESATNTAIQTAIGTALIGGFGAHRDVQAERNISAKSTIYNAAVYHDKALDAINIGYEAGLYDNTERDAKISVLNTATQSLAVLDKTEKVAGKTLARPERELYVANLTAEAVLNGQRKEMDEIGQKTIDEKISNLQNQRQQILNGEVVIDDNGNVSMPSRKETIPQTESVAVADNQILPTLEKVKEVVPEEKLQAAQDILTRVNNAENINVNDIESAQNELYSALDAAPEAAHLIEPLILKLQDYEFTTKTETSTVTEERPVEVARPVTERKAVNKSISQWEGNRATITDDNGNTTEGIINLEDGKYYLKNESGEKVAVLGERAITDRDVTLPSIEKVPNPIQFDDNGDIKSMTLQLNKVDKENGGTVPDKLITINFKDKEKALDYAIQLRVEQVGEFPQPEFDVLYEQVQKEVSREVPINQNAEVIPTTNEKTNQQTNTQNQQGNIAPEATQPANTAVNQNTQSAETQGGQINGGGTPPDNTIPPNTVVTDENGTELSFKGLQEIADEFYLDDITSRDRKSDVQLLSDANKTIAKWVAEGTYIKNVHGLVLAAENSEVLNDEQRIILQQHIANVRNAAREAREQFGVNSKEFDTALKSLKRLNRAGMLTRSEAGATLRIGRGTDSLIRYDLPDMMTAKMESLNVDELTERQKADIEKKFNEITTKVRDAEEKIRLLEAEVAKYKADAELKKEGKSSKSRSGTPKTHETYVKERNALREKLKEQVNAYRAEGQKMGISSDGGANSFIMTAKMAQTVMDIVKSHVEEVGNDLRNVTLRTYDDVKDLISGITEKDIHDVIAGRYSEPQRTKTQLENDLNDIKTEAKLINKLADLENGVIPKSEKQKIARNQQIKDLRDKLKMSPEVKLNNIRERNLKAAQNIKDKIDRKEFAPFVKSKVLENDEIRKKFPLQYKDALDAISAKENAQHDFEVELLKDAHSKRGFAEKYIYDPIKDAIGTAKALKAGIDFSALFIQNVVPIISHPIDNAPNIARSFRDTFSNKEFERGLAELHSSKWWGLMQKSGLDVTEPKSIEAQNKEEYFNRNLLEKDFTIKGKKYNIGKYVTRPFERAFTSLGNNIRVSTFLRLAQKLLDDGNTFENNPKVFKDLAKLVNTQTGRGTLPDFINKSTETVNTVIWSPRLMASRLNLLGIGDIGNPLFAKRKGFYAGLDPRIRNRAILDMVKFIGGVVSIYALAAWVFGAEPDLDPESVTFGDLKGLDENKSYNMFGGFSQYIKLLAIAGHRERKIGKRVENLGDAKGQDGLDIIGKFMNGKVTPVVGSAMHFYTQKDYFGRPIDNKKELLDLITPLSSSGIVDDLKRDGTVKAFANGLISMTGINVKDERDYQRNKK